MSCHSSLRLGMTRLRIFQQPGRLTDCGRYCQAVLVDAKDDDAATFYRKYGFLELPKVPRRLRAKKVTA